MIHFTLAVYINAVLPGKYGVRKNPLYFLKVKNNMKHDMKDIYKMKIYMRYNVFTLLFFSVSRKIK